MSRGAYRARGSSRPPVPLWRAMVVTIGVFWVMAAIAYVASLLIPTPPSIAPLTSSSGFDYFRVFEPFLKTFLLWVAGILLVLGPFTALWFAAERGGGKLLNRALGRDDRQ